MTPWDRALLAHLSDSTGFPPDPEESAFWLLDELRFVRRDAQNEADVAYERWSASGGHEAYVAYRAAQDRADAAQDHLAHWVARAAR
jgi:hypothetical protein